MALEQLGTPESPTLGLDTFGDRGTGRDGEQVSHAEAIRQVVAEGVLADGLGVDFFGVGEHHRDDFAVSAPDMVLAAIAARTERIRLGTSVTVLSSDEPVRVFERFATLDAISRGRAEVTLGRGSFTESFPLFGFRLEDYEVLFAEKLDLVRGAAEGEAGHLARHHPTAAGGPAGVPADRVGPAADLDRGRRHGPVGDPRGPLRPAAGASRSSAGHRSSSCRWPTCTARR